MFLHSEDSYQFVECLNSQIIELAFFLQGQGRRDEAQSFEVWVGITYIQYCNLSPWLPVQWDGICASLLHTFP